MANIPNSNLELTVAFAYLLFANGETDTFLPRTHLITLIFTNSRLQQGEYGDIQQIRLPEKSRFHKRIPIHRLRG